MQKQVCKTCRGPVREATFSKGAAHQFDEDWHDDKVHQAKPVDAEPGEWEANYKERSDRLHARLDEEETRERRRAQTVARG